MNTPSVTLSRLRSITKKLIKIIKLFFKSKKFFRSPKKAKILIYDQNRKENLIPLFNGEPYVVYCSRWESINISGSIIIRSFLFFLKNKKIKGAYASSFMDQVEPSIVITATDNDRIFQALDAKNKNDRIKFITIQNGNRRFNGSMQIFDRDQQVCVDAKTIYHSNFFCFGEYDVYVYKKYKTNVKFYYPCGSLSDSLYRLLPVYKSCKIADICLVSNSWSEYWEQGVEESFGHLKEKYKCLLNYLKKFQKRHGVTIIVAGAISDTDDYKTDADWHRKYLGSDIAYVPREKKSQSSYSLTDQAEVVVGMHSTLLREALGRGNKVLECNFSDPYFEVIQGDTWLLREKKYNIFEQKILNLLHMDDEDYKTLCGEYPFYLIGYNKEKPTHTVIGDFIAKHINSLRT
jgi:surface carbohydrate biosynthesis protein